MPEDQRGAGARAVRVLLVAHDRALGDVLCDELRLRGHAPTAVSTLALGREALRRAEFEVIVAELSLPDGDGLSLLRAADEEGQLVELLALTADDAVPAALEALRRGAYDYVPMPARMDELALLVSKAAYRHRLRRELHVLRQQRHALDAAVEVLAAEPVTRALLQAVDRVAAAEVPLLIEGEPGAGKTHLARLVHLRSQRAEEPFVVLDCADAGPALDSLLFGTGSGGAAHGPSAVALARDGTLFLGSIDAAPGEVQERVAAVLTNGGHAAADVARQGRGTARLLCGARRSLGDETRWGHLHPRLADHLADGTLVVPPLRERLADVPLLAEHFLSAAARGRRLTPSAHVALLRYPWPGNAGELKLVVERAALVGRGDEVGAEHLLLDGTGEWHRAAVRAGLSLAEIEMQYIQATLAQNEGHRGRTARALGIDPKTLYNKLGPQRPRRRA